MLSLGFFAPRRILKQAEAACCGKSDLSNSNNNRAAILTAKLEDTPQCLNFLLRRSARILTRLYDDALRPVGLRSTQFNVMAVLAMKGPTPLSALATVMAMERSALARNLKPLERKSFVAINVGKDRRTRIAALTPSGRRKLTRALPHWVTAQDQARKLVGNAGANNVAKLARKIASSATPET